MSWALFFFIEILNPRSEQLQQLVESVSCIIHAILAEQLVIRSMVCQSFDQILHQDLPAFWTTLHRRFPSVMNIQRTCYMDPCSVTPRSSARPILLCLDIEICTTWYVAGGIIRQLITHLLGTLVYDLAGGTIRQLITHLQI